MTIGGLMTVVGIVIALYALARPAQRQSIRLFVSVKTILVPVVCSAVIVLVIEGLEAGGFTWHPVDRFLLNTWALFLPILAAVQAYSLWCNAELSPQSTSNFKLFLLASLHDGTFDELIRILSQNAERLPGVLDRDTMDLLFDRRSIRTLLSARSSIHLELLMNRKLLQAFPRHFTIIDRLVREYLASDESPLRTAALMSEGGDETLSYSDEESDLIKKTFLDPDWYRDCRVGYPILMVAVERLRSGEFDGPYNRNDPLYIAAQGVSSRSQCPLFLGEKTIVNGLKKAISRGSEGDFHVTDLSDLFRNIAEHSRHNLAVWEFADSGCMEFPTPFAYLMSAICLDLEFLSDDILLEANDGGQKPESHIAMDIGRTWALCVSRLAYEPQCASEDFRLRKMRAFLSFVLERLYVDDENEKATPLAVWRDYYLGPLKRLTLPRNKEQFAFLTAAADGLDTCMRYVEHWQDQLREELELPPRA